MSLIVRNCQARYQPIECVYETVGQLAVTHTFRVLPNNPTVVPPLFD